MCGLFGFCHSSQPVSDAHRVLARMGQALIHRGPDQAGSYWNGAVGLGHRRLSVIDPSEAGRQPMSNEAETAWIVFNGEIYNFLDLRASLEAEGYRFRSATDTEVILGLYERDGIDCLNQLRGMFAFAIWDIPRERLFLARDRLGKKPLVFYHEPQHLVFASEIKALLHHPRISREVDAQSIDEYLSFQYIPAPYSIFKNVNKLQPAHYLLYEKGHIDVRRYWTLDFPEEKLVISPGEACDRLLNQLEESVRVRLKSDVPLGAFLSGGVDSSAVVALMARNLGSSLKTFSIGFEETDYNETPYARQVADRFQTDHHEFIVRPDAAELLPKLVWHYDEPYSDSSALPTYYLSQLTRQHVTVALNGDGGDEALSGYDKYLAMKLYRYLNRLPDSLRQSLQHLGRRLPQTAHRRTLFRKFKRFLETSSGDFRQDYLRLMTLFDPAHKKRLYAPQFRRALQPADPTRRRLENLFRQASPSDWVDWIAHVDYHSYLPYDLLTKVDIASMANSLEVRSPFLDHHLVEWVATLPTHLKLRGLRTKYLLKRALEGLLPSAILHRRKMGFGVPLDHWFRGELKPFAYETLLADRCVRRGYFEPSAVRELLDQHTQGQQDQAYKIWNLLVLEIWHQVYMD